MTARVRELMTSDVASCRRDASLSAAAMLMWDRDCGFLPVVDDAGHVVGVITDRDICMAAALRDRAESHISVGEALSGHPVSVGTDDAIATALERMREHRIRRMPVVDGEGHLRGVLSMNDLVLYAGAGAADPQAVVETLRGICAHRRVAVSPA